MKHFAIKSIGGAARALIGWPLLLAGLYMIAAAIGSLVSRNADWAEPAAGITFWVHDNGIHTSIIAPCAARGAVAQCLFPTASEIGPAASRTMTVRYQMIGWGDRDFYLNTPRWRDISARTALAALVGSGHSLVHVTDLEQLPPGNIRPVRLDEAASLRLMQSLTDSAAIYGPDRVRFRSITGYGPHDRFFLPGTQPDVRMTYSALYTCNNWVSDHLAIAGVKTGQWTPLPFGIMWWLPER